MSIYTVTKICNCCGQDKPLNEFHRYKSSGKEYHRNKCKQCTSEYYRSEYAKNQKIIRDRARKSYYSNQSVVQEKAREKYRQKTKHVYELFYERQGGVCAVCNQPETATRNGRIKDLALDHCHTTGNYRGLLCQCCNTALGRVKDDVTLLENMIGYLQNGKNYTCD